MKYQLDQSIRIEETNKATYIALANNKEFYVIKLLAKHKRTLQEEFRRQGMPKKYMISVFAASIVLIIKKSGFQVTDIVIDIEYPGYELDITRFIKKLYSDIRIYFSAIGKSSPAHFAGYGAHIGKRKENYLVSLGDIMRIIKKTESPLRT